MPSKKSKNSKSDRRWSIYPALHNDVSCLLEEEDLHFDFHENDDSEGCVEEWETNIMGHFKCCNRACSKRWQSKVIATTIRMYPGAQYNARVYNQHCKKCDSLGKPRLDNSYAERVAYRLKIWSGVEMKKPPYSGVSKGPHEIELCEGCKNGHCTQSQSRRA